MSNGGFMGGGWGQAPTQVHWQGYPFPEKWRRLEDLRQLLPDVIPPPSLIAARAAMHFMRTGVPAYMVVRPEYVPAIFPIMQGFAMYRRADLEEFVRMPELAYLFDEWCVEDLL